MGNKHRFIYGHQYHLRCLVQPHDPSIGWHVVRIDLVYHSRLVFAEAGVVVGRGYLHLNKGSIASGVPRTE